MIDVTGKRSITSKISQIRQTNRIQNHKPNVQRECSNNGSESERRIIQNTEVGVHKQGHIWEDQTELNAGVRLSHKPHPTKDRHGLSW